MKKSKLYQNCCLVLGGFLLISVSLVAINRQPAAAQSPIPAGCPGGPAGPPSPGTICPTGEDAHGDPAEGAESRKSGAGGSCPSGYLKLGVPLENGNDCLREGTGRDNPIFVYLRTIIRFLAAGVGAVVMLMIVISGVQYITSAGNPEAVQGAKKRLTNAIIALLLFIFMSAILNFLVPGGLL